MDALSPVIRKHFLNPLNVGGIPFGGFLGRGGSLICGATVRVSLSMDSERRITEAKFKTAGCSWLVGAASYLTTQIQGEVTSEVASLVQAPATTVREALGEIPSDRQHCVALICEAVLAAITAYSDSVRDEWHGDEALICSCFSVSERTIEAAIIKGNLQSITDVTKACNAGGGCRSCYSLIEDMLSDLRR